MKTPVYKVILMKTPVYKVILMKSHNMFCGTVELWLNSAQDNKGLKGII